MNAQSTKVNALEFLNANVDSKLTVFWAGIGNPTGTELAYAPHYYEIPIDGLEDCEGEVKDGQWRWDGKGDAQDARRNSVTQIVIGPNTAEYDRQITEYESYPG